MQLKYWKYSFWSYLNFTITIVGQTMALRKQEIAIQNWKFSEVFIVKFKWLTQKNTKINNLIDVYITLNFLLQHFAKLL